MEDENKYGLLLNQNIKLHRQYFREMVKLHGIWVLYRAPYAGKTWTTYAELETNYDKPIKVGILFHQHPDQKTVKKMGWISELSDDASLIEVDYDLPGLQKGCLIIVPSGLDNAEGRLFRIDEMQTSMVYPASVTCSIVPEYEDTMMPETYTDYSNKSFTFANNDLDRMFNSNQNIF